MLGGTPAVLKNVAAYPSAPLWNGGRGGNGGEGKAELCEFRAKQPDKGNGPEGKPELLALAAGEARPFPAALGGVAVAPSVELDRLAWDPLSRALGPCACLAEWDANPWTPPLTA